MLNYLTSLVFLVGLPQRVRSVERWIWTLCTLLPPLAWMVLSEEVWPRQLSYTTGQDTRESLKRQQDAVPYFEYLVLCRNTKRGSVLLRLWWIMKGPRRETIHKKRQQHREKNFYPRKWKDQAVINCQEDNEDMLECELKGKPSKSSQHRNLDRAVTCFAHSQFRESCFFSLFLKPCIM